MKPKDDPELVRLVKATGEIYSRQVSMVAAVMFLSDLDAFSSDQVKSSLKRCRQELKTFPTVADIILRIDDGRPGVEEAWSMLPKSEADSVVWTPEMAEAWGVAKPLLLEGDPVAARMAFKESYSARLAEKRRNAEPVEWTPSLGHDPGTRAAALEEAVRKKRIEIGHARQLLPILEDRSKPRGGLSSIGEILASKQLAHVKEKTNGT